MRPDRPSAVLPRVLLLCLAVGALDAQVPVIVTLSTSATTLQGGQTATLTALVVASGPPQGVNWDYNPKVGTLGVGNPVQSNGSSTNLYQAPSQILSHQTITITAIAKADTSKSYSVDIQLTPGAITVTPSTVTLSVGQSQQFSAAGSPAGVTWSISPSVGTIGESTGLYTAPSTITASQTVTVTATSTSDVSVTGTAKVSLQAPPSVSISISPTSVSLTANQSQQFTATVQNGVASVIWSISPQVGTIDNTGLYTAPVLISGTQKITVTAASQADSSKSASATVTLSTVTDVGSGAPTGGLQQQFVSAFFRNGFYNLVSLPPLGAVKKLGTTGYVQEFSDAAKTSGVKLALASASAASAAPSSDGTVTQIVQLLSDLYAYYTSVGAATAGYPNMDTQKCPYFDLANSCTWDIFDKGYALFAYKNALATGQNFTIRQAFYTEWTNRGGIGGPGLPVDVETAITASTATTATVQTFTSGAIYSISSGPNRNLVFGVVQPIYGLYVTNGGPGGGLGLPTGAELALSSGVHRQNFEGGALEYTPGGSGPSVRLPVTSVALSGAPSGASVTLKLGDVLTLAASPMTSAGTALTDRAISWSSTNSKVIAIQANNQTAVLKAVGGGSATVVAASEGVSSPKLSLIVIAPCCQIGEGAPAAIGQSFQDALTRNKISVLVPVQVPATRVGSGYVQMVQSSDANAPGVYMLAQSDRLGQAFVAGGAVLARYQDLGGPGGALGYPISDQTAGGRQLFENSAALAGNPVRLVSGVILSKWALVGYETGAAGDPLSESSPFSTFGANSGVAQSFRNGAIYGATAGPRSPQAYFVSGLILARYNAIGGPAGDFGMPVGDEFVTAGVHQQNFEGGNITYSAGDSAAKEHAAPKVPAVIVSPPALAAGGRARLAVIGFPNNSTIRVSVSGQPDFLVATSNGAYSWDMSIPLASKSATLSIHAADTKGPSTADGALTVKGFADNRVQIAKLQGDNQTGVPGAVLPIALKIAVRDSAGDPVTGAPVVFQASPGSQLSSVSAVTDAAGQAATFVRLPGAEGVALVTADAPSIALNPVTFAVRAAASSLSNFPKLQQAGDTPLGNGTATIARKGALLTAVASILRYHQNRGELPSPNGTADPGALNQFLNAWCVVDAKGNQLCDGFLSNPDSGEQIVNLWRAAEFTGGVDVSVETPTLAAIADLVAQGSPLLLSLGLSLNGAAMGGHFVVAMGVAPDGSIVIQDPNPLFARANLNDYLTGFTAAAGTWKASLRGVVRFALRSPAATRFLLAALSQPADLVNNLAFDVRSVAGACGLPLDLLDAVDSSGNGAGALLSRIQVCDGSQPAYQVSVGAAQPYRAFVTDLAPRGSSVDVSGNAPATYKASRPLLNLELAPQDVSFTADAVVNAATFTSGIAPGGIMAIFGTGLSGLGTATTVDMDGAAARVIAASPFQINAQVPPNMTPGVHTLRVRSAYGAAQQSVNVSVLAPAIFLIGNPPAGALENQDNSLNGPANPLPRGQVLVVYATGLGAVTTQGQLSVTRTPVTVVINGTELPVAFAGLTPGYVGLYQVNVVIPATTPPGLGIPLTLKQGGQLGNTVAVALQ